MALKLAMFALHVTAIVDPYAQVIREQVNPQTLVDQAVQ